MTTEVERYDDTKRQMVATHVPDPFLDADPDDLIVPRRSLVQGTSRNTDTKMAGHFFDSLSKDYKAGLMVAVLAQRKTRALFGESFDDPPVCQSHDAVTPQSRVSTEHGLTGPTCEECYFSQWGSDPKGGEGQACKLSFDLLCYDLDDKSPFMLRVSGSSIRPWREFVTDSKRAGIRASGVETAIASKEVVFPRGKAFVLTFSRGAALDGELATEMQRTAGVYQGAKANDEVAVEPEELPFE